VFNVIILQPKLQVFLKYMHSSFNVGKKTRRVKTELTFDLIRYLAIFNKLTQNGRLVFTHLTFSIVKKVGYAITRLGLTAHKPSR